MYLDLNTQNFTTTLLASKLTPRRSWLVLWPGVLSMENSIAYVASLGGRSPESKRLSTRISIFISGILGSRFPMMPWMRNMKQRVNIYYQTSLIWKHPTQPSK